MRTGYGIAYVALLAVLPLLGSWARSGGGPVCAFDGGTLDPRYRVRAGEVSFCCIRCAELWHQREAQPAALFVVDETSGDEMPADGAFFVRSRVVTNRTTGNRVHAFRKEADAVAHAQASGGRVLTDDERPFRPLVRR
jgi:hypothetical protein